MGFNRTFGQGHARPLSRPFTGNEGIYFDSTAAGGGDGSLSRPYNSLATLNALTGNRNGVTAYLRRGQTWRYPLSLTNVSNLNIDAYGSGAKPTIALLTTLTSANWVDDTATVPGRWYMTASTNYGYLDLGLFLDGVPLHRRGAVADLVNYYERAEDGTSYARTYCFDYGTNRMYIHIPSGNPTTMVTQRGISDSEINTLTSGTVTTAAVAVSVGTVSNIGIRNIQACGGFSSQFFGAGFTSLTVEGCHAYGSSNRYEFGGAPAYAQNLYSFTGASRASRSTGLRLINNTSADSYGTNSNALEISYLSGVVVEGNSFKDFRGNAVEFWNSCADVKIRRNYFAGGSNFVKLFNADGDDLTIFDDILICNNVYQARSSYLNPGGASNATADGGGCIDLSVTDYCSHKNFRVINNTLHISDNIVVRSNWSGAAHGGGDGTFRFKNNLVIVNQPTSHGYGGYMNAIYTPDAIAQANDWVIDYNVYQFGRDTIQSVIVGNFYESSLAQMVTAWGGVTGATTNEDHSYQASSASSIIAVLGTMFEEDLRPLSGASPQVGRADPSDPDYPVTDFTGATRSRNTVGAYD